MDADISFLDELSGLFSHISVRVSSYFESPGEWARSFSAKRDEIASALDKIKHGVPPSVALTDAVKTGLPRHVSREEVVECIRVLGGDELSIERERIVTADGRMKEIASRARAEADEANKIRSALFALIALGAIIILI